MTRATTLLGSGADFVGRIVLIGYGTIGHCLLPMMLERLPIGASRVRVLDGASHHGEIESLVARGLDYRVQPLSPDNLHAVMGTVARAGDVVVNVSIGVDSIELADWCQHHDVAYVDSSVEPWEEQVWRPEQNPRDRTEYVYHQRARARAARWRPGGASAVVCHGANPGLVSHFVKAALLDVCAALDIDPGAPDGAADWAMLAERTGTRVIHVSERDTQISNRPKRPGEFVNTWSIPGFLEEASMPVEIGWGTHERTLPRHAKRHRRGPRNAIYIPQASARVWVRSWVPLGGPIDGYALPHSEAVTISEYLTRYGEDGPVYRPTVLFAYLPCDAAMASLHESVMHDWREPELQRVMNEDIVDGRDELGVLLLGHGKNGWWYGSQLDIHEARELVPGNNPTAVQVAAGVLAATAWVLRNPRGGYREPEALPHDQILEVARAYLGPMISCATDWNPLASRQVYFEEPWLDRDDPWQFGNFLAH